MSAKLQDINQQLKLSQSMKEPKVIPKIRMDQKAGNGCLLLTSPLGRIEPKPRFKLVALFRKCVGMVILDRTYGLIRIRKVTLCHGKCDGHYNRWDDWKCPCVAWRVSIGRGTSKKHYILCPATRLGKEFMKLAGYSVIPNQINWEWVTESSLTSKTRYESDYRDEQKKYQ